MNKNSDIKLVEVSLVDVFGGCKAKGLVSEKLAEAIRRAFVIERGSEDTRFELLEVCPDKGWVASNTYQSAI